MCHGDYPIPAADAQEAPSSETDEEIYEDYTDLWTRGEYAQALEVLEENITSQTRPMDSWLYDKAQLLFTVGRVDEAIEIMDELARRKQQPSHGLYLALLHKYRGHPQTYDSALRVAAGMINQRWRWQNRRYVERDQNVAAIGHIYEYLGNNPKTILSAHYKQYLDVYETIGPVVDVAAGEMAYRTGNYNVAAGYF